MTASPVRLNNAWSGMWRAFSEAKRSILIVGVTYAASVLLGMWMAHTGNSFALSYRDRLVTRARANSSVLSEARHGRPVRAALLDFGGNLLLGAVPSTVGGWWIHPAFVIAAYRGWVGGVVSINDRHASRLATGTGATYYVLTLVLQIIPFAMAGGAGLSGGWAWRRRRGELSRGSWAFPPRDIMVNSTRLYILIVPLFLIASLWEFLAPVR